MVEIEIGLVEGSAWIQLNQAEDVSVESSNMLPFVSLRMRGSE